MDQWDFCVRRMVFVAVLAVVAGCVPKPRAGIRSYEERNLVHFSNGISINVAGGNAIVRRTDLSLDTKLGTYGVQATYNSATGEWRHNLDMTYDGQTFVDDTGAAFEIGSLGNNQPIPGTHWVKIDDDEIKTAGGLVHGFWPGGRLASVRWSGFDYPRLNFVTFYDGTEWLTTVKQCDSEFECFGVPVFTMRFTFGKITSVTDWAQRQAVFGYDHNARLASARDGLDVETGAPGFRYSYANGRLVSVMNSEGEEVRIAYDIDGRATRVMQMGGGNPQTTFKYLGENDDELLVTRVTNPEGHTSTYCYDNQRRLRQSETPLGDRTTLAWNGTEPFRLASTTTPAGATTNYLYPSPNIVEEHQPSGNVVTTEFADFASDAARRDAPNLRAIVSRSDLVGDLETNTYLENGWLWWSENGESDRTYYTHDELGLVTKVQFPNGVEQEFTQYQFHGHPGNGWLYGSPNNWYDAMGNLRIGSRRDGPNDPGRPGVESREFDADRNLVALTVGGRAGYYPTPFTSETTTMTYRSDGRLLYVARPTGADHAFVYDSLGQQIEKREKVDGVWQIETRTYYPDGMISSISRANGMRTEFFYDEDNRPWVTRFLRDGVLESTLVHEYENGQLRSVADSGYGYDNPESYVYDAAGRVIDVTFPNGETVQTSYDLRSRVASRTYALPAHGTLRTLTFGYDLADRTTSVSDGAGVQVTRAFSHGEMVQETFRNGLARTYTYADGNRYSSQTNDATNSTIESTTISRYEPENYIASILIEGSISGPAGGVYDKYYQLSGIPHQRGFQIDDYAFDHYGNRAELAYNGERNRLTSYRYDDAGFVVQRGNDAMSWNALGRVTSIGADTYSWDANGRPRQFNINGTTTEFRFGGAVEIDSAGAPVALDLAEFRVDLTGADNHRYRHRDFRGNVRFVSDQNGDAVTRYEYGAYGVSYTEGETDNRNFAGGYDLGHGLLWLGARVYDSNTGQFLSQDPVFQLRSQYTYTGGDPVNFGDPNGRHSTPQQQLAAARDAAFDANVSLALALGGVAVAVVFAPATVTAAAVAGVVLASGNFAFQFSEAIEAEFALQNAELGVQAASINALINDFGVDAVVDLSIDSFGLAYDFDSGTVEVTPHTVPGGWRASETWIRWRGGPRGGGGLGCAPATLANELPATNDSMLLFGLLAQLLLGSVLLCARRRGNSSVRRA